MQFHSCSSTMRNEIKLNLDLFRRSPHLCLRCTIHHTHTRTPTHPWSPSPCQHPSREIRRLETGQPWPMYIFMGLIWHHLSRLPEKEMYLIYTIPIWLAHQVETHRESRPMVRASSLYGMLVCTRSVCIYKLCMSICFCIVCQKA